MKKLLSEKTLKFFLRLLLGLVFIVSGISKLISPDNFISEVDKLNFLSSAFTQPAVYIFILLELILALFILFKPNNKVLGVTIAIMVIFCCYLGYKIFIGDAGDCGCFGNFIYRSNMSALIQDIFILMTAVYLYESREEKIP